MLANRADNITPGTSQKQANNCGETKAQAQQGSRSPESFPKHLPAEFQEMAQTPAYLRQAQ